MQDKHFFLNYAHIANYCLVHFIAGYVQDLMATVFDICSNCGPTDMELCPLEVPANLNATFEKGDKDEDVQTYVSRYVPKKS